MSDAADQRPPDLDGDESPAPSSEKDKLRAIAKWQRAVIFALLANITLNVTFFCTQGAGLTIQLLILLLTLIVVVIAVASIFMLAREVYSVGLAVLCAVLMFVPCVSLITLLVVNQSATSYLQLNGVKVGFMGVDPRRI